MFDAFIGKDEDRATRYQYYVDLMEMYIETITL